MKPTKDSQPNALKAEAELADIHEMLGQHCADLGSRKDAKNHMRIARTIRTLRSALIDANDALRSTHSVATRRGLKTNWEPFQRKITRTLSDQHNLMYPRCRKEDGE